MKAGKKEPLDARRIVGAIEADKRRIRKFGVKRIGLFGSFASGRPRKRSDIDFLVSFGKPTYDNYIRLKFFLERKFGRKADIVTENSLHPYLSRVKKEALYAKGL